MLEHSLFVFTGREGLSGSRDMGRRIFFFFQDDFGAKFVLGRGGCCSATRSVA